MREIKFRVWHKIWKRMYEMDCTHYIDAPEYGDPIAWGNPDFEFMQFTGLKDKNGREIYEGDIVRADWHWETPHLIEWPDDLYDICEYCISDCLEVLGNIYENPELMEAK